MHSYLTQKYGKKQLKQYWAASEMPKSSHLTIRAASCFLTVVLTYCKLPLGQANAKSLHETLHFVLPCFCKSKHITLLALFYRQVKWGTGTLSNVPEYYICLHSLMTQRYLVYLSVHFPNSQSLQKMIPIIINSKFLPAS